MDFISVVIPVYKSKESLPILMEELRKVFHLSGFDYEVIMVDDCSPGGTWEELISLKRKFHELKIIRLVKNSGQHNAILCGFNLSRGDIVITMDDDLQNPPSEIPKLMNAIHSGYDMAIGAYDSKKHSLNRNVGGRLIDTTLRHIFHLPKKFQLTSFRAARKSVIDNVISMGGVFPYITAMLFSHASRYVNVDVHHAQRRYGQSNYNLKRSVFLALNLLLSYSAYPLYFVAGLCLSVLGCSMFFSFFIFFKVIFQGNIVPGWASTIIFISFFNGLVLLALVIHSIYLSRLNQQITRSRVGFTVGEIHE